MQKLEWMQQDELQYSSLTEKMACSPVNSATVRKTRPYPNQVLKCPRCDSFNTKFCYYNNYRLTQPRHFCKSCKRYWTKGGALRNVPPGGGCRKNTRSKVRIADQQHGVATITVGEGSGSIEKFPNKILCNGADTTVSGDNSSVITSATNAPTHSSIHGSPSPNTPLPQIVIGNCVPSGYPKLPPDGEEPVTILFDGINTSSEGSPKTPMSRIGRSASPAFLALAGEQEEQRVRMLLDAEQNFNGCSMFDAVNGRTEQLKFSASPLIFSKQESNNLPVFFPCSSIPRLDGLSSPDSTLLASDFSSSEILKRADQIFMHNSRDDLTCTFETPSHRMYDVSPASSTESIIVSSIGPNMSNCSNLGFHGRLQDCKHHHHLQHHLQQQLQDEERFISVMPANQITMDEQTWRRMTEGASVEKVDETRDNPSISGSQTYLYDVGSVGRNWPMCSKEYFDPTDDQCYMGGPELWHDITTFYTGTRTPF